MIIQEEEEDYEKHRRRLAKALTKVPEIPKEVWGKPKEILGFLKMAMMCPHGDLRLSPQMIMGMDW